MTVVNPKSISGITSITTASGSDNLLTIHTNNGTERLRVDSTGATKIVTGIVTTLTATTGIVTTLTANTVTSLGAVSGTTGTFTNSLTINTTTDQMLNLNSTDNGGTYIGYQRSGTRTAYLGHGGTGSTFTLRNEIENGNVDIRGNDGGSYVTMLNLNTGVGGTATFSSDLIIPDKIVHTGDTNTAIRFPAADSITAETGGSERLRIDSSGRMSLGTTDASQFNAGADDFVIQGSGSCGITIDATSSSNSNIYFADGPTGSEAYRGYTQYQHSNDTFVFGRAGVDHLYLQNDGGTKNVLGNFIVGTSGRGLQFNASDSGSSELLDDYEQGDFVPSFTVASGSVTFDSSRKTLCYTKIGRKVTIIGQLKVSSVSGPSGIFRASLPFTRGNQTEQAERTVGTIVVTGAAVNNANEFTTYPDGDTSSYLEICSTSGTTINRNGGQNMQAGAFIYVNYTYFTA